ncbi:hypothetical protein GJV85_02020 [Sulfurimonas aquatica]|uniref:Uncharacterized protein n=1 Tax=Sulfurimonas aquatica TaxID=2672570 RepID=A0A975AYQ1_9BACT|nr:hypothetical protein [Sulfurimonas aquatica]QSZ40938.1 hypothetical protein GJV85_02020 [Sulfurimonas aquatica]
MADDNSIEYKIEQKNRTYYDFISRKEHQKKHQKPKGPRSFAKQELSLKDITLAPEGWEGTMFTVYAVSIPYIFGYLFLTYFIAGGNFKNSVFADTDSFLIVWLIGYEIVAGLAMIWITVLFFTYDEKKSKHRY